MKQKTIKVSNKTNARVQTLKYTLHCSSADETINRLLDIVEKIEEAKE
ncbi:hypothetical protein LCGC14_0439380 [marine sediment metagenome]|uniref:Uncharacterized protein n=1 Tax=marine sediment metagenome TaxID=412755 RepID=A0A0F9SKY3_9ZZZZ